MVDPLVDELEKFEKSSEYQQLEKDCENFKSSGDIRTDLE